MKILIIGSSGLLSNKLYSLFKDDDEYDTIATSRNASDQNDIIQFDAITDSISALEVQNYDYVLNCIGIIKPDVKGDEINTIIVNSIFPRVLANECESNNVKLLHISTDCVYDGANGNYDENSPHDCIDLYGQSKSAGEPDNCMVIRTSIIGEEVQHSKSLMEWVKSNNGKTINGYTNHIWNGITTNQYYKIIKQIIEEDLFQIGTYHVFSDVVTKYELTNLINDKFDLGINIIPFEPDIGIDRSLFSKFDLCEKLSIPTLAEQINEL